MRMSFYKSILSFKSILAFTFFSLSFVTLRAQNIAVNTSGAAAASTNMFEVTQTSAAANMVAIYAINSGATAGTGYGLYSTKTGAGTTNVGGYFSATGGANNYAGIFDQGFVGMGITTPAYPLHVYNSQNAGTYHVVQNPNAGASALAGLIAYSNAGTFAIQVASTALGGWAEIGTTGNGGFYHDIANAAGDYIWRTTTAYTERMRLTSAGRLGIGTPSPANLLHVSGSGIPGIRLSTSVAASTDKTVSFDLLENEVAGVRLFYEGATGNELEINDFSTGTNLMTIERAGNVGIGTITPGLKFHVFNGASGTAATIGAAPWNTYGQALIENSGDAGLYISNPNANVARIMLSTPGSLSAGHVGGMLRWDYTAKSFDFGTDEPTGFVRFMTASFAERMRIDANGNVGIGTTTPSSKLTVAIPSTNSITTVDATSTAGLTLAGTGDLVRLQMGVGSSTMGPYGGWIQASYDNTSIGGSNGVEPLVLNPSGGNVGIGIIAPLEKLHVVGNARVSSLAGTGTRVVQADANGTVVPLAAGTSSQVMLGTGAWGAVPGGSGNYIQNQFAAAQTGDHWIGGSSRALEVYCDSWFRNNSTGTGLYNTATGRHFYADGASYWSLTTGNGMIFRDAYASTIQGYVYNDGTNFGILNRGGAWGFGTSTTRAFVLQPLMVNGSSTPLSALGVGGGAAIGSYSATAAPTNGLIVSGNVGIGTASPAYKLAMQVLASTTPGDSMYGAELTDGTRWMHIYPGTVGAQSWNNIMKNFDNAIVYQAGGAFTIAPWTGGPSGLRIEGDNGYVGIGVHYLTAYSYKLQVNGTANCSLGAWSSDIRLKRNVKELGFNGLNIINKLRPVTFEWKEAMDLGMEGTQMGFIAQELEEILPTMVLTGKDGSKAVKYNEMLPILVKAIQEQQKIIDKQQSDMASMKLENQKMKAEFNAMKNAVDVLLKQSSTEAAK